MKTLLSLIFLMASFNTFAGTLVNKRTGESIQFQLDTESSQVSVISRASGLESSTVFLKNFSVDKNSPDYFHFTNWLFAELSPDEEVLYMPPMIVAPLAMHALDLLTLPVKATLSVLKNSKNKKAFKVILRAITFDETIELGDKTFSRVVKNLAK